MNINQMIKNNRPLVMGIINCTPDSFYEGSRSGPVDYALKTAAQMISDGVHILDIGGESSRPGSSYVSAEQELERVIPVIKAIKKEFTIPVSIDTRKKAVAEAAFACGADIIDDISALQDDPDLGIFAAENDIPVILMHMKGNPENMQNKPFYDDVVKSVSTELKILAENALAAGIRKDNIILDPGIGFGKRFEDNINLLKGISELKKEGYPLLIGLSRKRFIGDITGRQPEGRLAGTLGATAFAVIEGADILRVHDVRETVDMVSVISELI